MEFPEHKASLYLTHNEHKSSYRRVEEEYPDEDYEHDWISPEQKQKAIETQDVWALQWYPDTPVGFCLRLGADLEEVLKGPA